MDEAHRACKSGWGLRPNIWTRLLALKLRRYAEIINMALIVEKGCEEYQKVRD